ncbi:hypothetical protein V1520DRAFT_335824 [Lipomyces starkeyi]|uniref:Uncharacterized protein n=1 Tax=Lipomyces starkeyi NRRL Y-11557 TaxID=675824 RepID=A0A1E3QEK6_LIPST|nr:hypothetical protein LIPSTDRAFT_67005 [Lipomyces starkeyi NRRL Y-11557]
MPRSSRPQSTYFPYVSSGPGTAEFLPPLHTPDPSPNYDSSAVSTSSTTQSRSQTRRPPHIHSYSFSPSASASASPTTTATSIHSQSPSSKTRSLRSQSSASSLSVNPQTSRPSSTAMTSSPGSPRSPNKVLASSAIHQHASSPSPLSKEEKLRRRASQPVLVRAQNPNTSPWKQSRPGGSLRTGIYGGIVGTGGVHDRNELVPVQYPAAGMFTVHAVLGSIGYSLPQFYETAFDFVEVCDAYFHMPGHLSPQAVLGRGN